MLELQQLPSIQIVSSFDEIKLIENLPMHKWIDLTCVDSSFVNYDH